MDYAAQVRSLMKKYGREMTFHILPEDAGVKYHAFLQPLRYKNKMYIEGLYTKYGYFDQTHFLYLGPPEVELDLAGEDSRIESGGQSYVVKKKETVFLAGKPYYQWAILQPLVF